MTQEGSSIEALLEALDSADWDVRINASNKLIAMAEQAHPALISEVQNGSVRRAVNAARVLSSQDAPHIYAAMVGLIASPNPLLGQIAVEYVARYPNSAPVLLDHLTASTYLVRISIVQALGNLRAKEAIDSLLQLLTAPDIGITLRLTVVNALGLLGDARAVPALESLLSSTDEHLNKRVRRSLDTLLLRDDFKQSDVKQSDAEKKEN